MNSKIIELLRELAAAEELYRLCLDTNGHEWLSTMLAKQKLEDKGNAARSFLMTCED